MNSGQHRPPEGDIPQLRRDVGETAEELAHRLDAPTRARVGAQQARAGAQEAMDNARTTAASIPPSRWAAAAAAAFAIAAAVVAMKEVRAS